MVNTRSRSRTPSRMAALPSRPSPSPARSRRAVAPPSPVAAAAEPSDDDVSLTESEPEFTAVEAPSMLSAEEVNARVRTIMMSLTFTLHLVYGLVAGPVMLFFPATAGRYFHGADSLSSLELAHIQYTGAAIMVFGLAGPAAGMIAKSRQALSLLVWLELFWCAFACLIAVAAFARQTGQSCMLGVSGPPAINETLLCINPELVTATVNLVLVFAYGYHGAFDDFSWAKAKTE